MSNKETTDPFSLALADTYSGKKRQNLFLNTSYGSLEEMPVAVFFRELQDLSEIELEALSSCRGKVLDVGAGVGSLSLILQEDHPTTALEINETACRIMKERGVRSTILGDFFLHEKQQYDTLFLMMNGIGLIGKLNRLEKFLAKAEELLLPGGQIIGDSSDIAYLYRDHPIPRPRHYYGEISYRYTYAGMEGNWFDWVYVDAQTLYDRSNQLGWNCEVLMKDKTDHFLFRLSRS